MICHHRILLKSGLIVPCGKCPACLANLRQEWIFRLKQEYLDSVFALFVTLTYDDEHLPKDLSVNKRDVQLFHKRLRKNFPSSDLRYYVVSEYGDRTHRPHYHGLYFFKHKYELDSVYKVFETSWSNGFCKFGNVELGSIVYCTKYCLKYSPTPEGRKDPFRLVSKQNGGLGSYYLKKMSDYHAESDNFSFVSSDGQRCRMPKYYKDYLHRHGIGSENGAQRDERLQDIYSKQKDDRIKRFNEFLKSHKGIEFDLAIKIFEEKEKKGFAAADDLVFKHVKKQTL